MRNIVSWDTVPIIMDVPLAAQIVGMNAEYLLKLARQRKFPAYKVSPRAWRVDKEDLMNWRQSLKEKQEV